jgi:hypothetical protein
MQIDLAAHKIWSGYFQDSYEIEFKEPKRTDIAHVTAQIDKHPKALAAITMTDTRHPTYYPVHITTHTSHTTTLHTKQISTLTTPHSHPDSTFTQQITQTQLQLNGSKQQNKNTNKL